MIEVNVPNGCITEFNEKSLCTKSESGWRHISLFISKDIL